MDNFDISKEVIDFVKKEENHIINKFKKIDEIKEFNQYKVIRAMHEVKLGATDFNWTTGYGYNDMGREKTERIYSLVFNSEDAIVRPTIASGTHALSLALNGILLPGDHLLSITGTPYDTLQQVIGIEGSEAGNLIEMGVKYDEIDLINGKIDLSSIEKYIKANTKLIMIQRSTGYSDRNAFTIEEIDEAIKKIKTINENIYIMVDNCYGEFLDYKEPTEVGADIIAGSLIKNPGGGIAISGGYIAGKEKLIERIANKLTAPGLGKDSGLTFGKTRNILQGLFLAPLITSEAVKGALLVGQVFSSLGYKVIPKVDDERSDIIQAIEFKDPKKVKAFCKGIQDAAAVDAHFTPIASEMPGYENEVIMASGSFIEGSSIELSADAPMRDPYYAYYQGGLTYSHCKLGIYKSLSNLIDDNLIRI